MVMRFCAARAGARVLVAAGAMLVAGFTIVHASDAMPGTPQLHEAAPAKPSSARCQCPARLSQFSARLVRAGRLLMQGAPLTIVALGSSSTAGAMASRPEQSYPNRLAAELQAKFPRSAIRVVNRGQNGDTVEGMLRRLDPDVLAEKPDLVIWQLGTNSVLRDEALGPLQSQVQSGLSRMRDIGADVILIDPQFAPRVNIKAGVRGMVHLIGTLASRDHIALFQRFEIMRHWHEEGAPFSAFLAGDELHHNDWSYGCMARLLARMIADAVAREETLRHAALYGALPQDFAYAP